MKNKRTASNSSLVDVKATPTASTPKRAATRGVRETNSRLQPQYYQMVGILRMDEIINKFFTVDVRFNDSLRPTTKGLYREWSLYYVKNFSSMLN
ncbi:unnamed protein product [Larinioides sclopetarius]|uniref:Uncharacterized protein n=1 Tax=Larinioides sclopetarius TaxID=280406 RepID=A0AAV1Z702_9ARAC